MEQILNSHFFELIFNDTPKILALLLAVSLFQIDDGLISLGIAMPIGRLINRHKVAERMSHDVCNMNHGQGFTANLVTGILVIFASRIGVPVSTTHVY
ncbi:MAG TPA: inorganic phosphate transporter [Spirochaetes bacterium]|nr:inorganic phosphate transporter [Spirochaetota bacterium]